MHDVLEGVRPGGERERRLSPAEPGLWHRVVEQLGTAVTVIDPAGRIVAVNPAAERLLGRPAAAMYGQDLHDLCHRDPGGARIARERCPLLRALAERRPTRGNDDRCLRDDGRLVPISWSATPLTQDGVSQGMVVLIIETASAGHAIGNAPSRRNAPTRRNEPLARPLWRVSPSG
ncbi:PAS domain-containing protein [Streptomyces sp. NPDC057611]|uniref:PAS domain-containing protein n=1 Tax=Streptomyces sp. NPDC057611 TaxID=3346182 RepID=UPI0036756686